MYVMRDLRALSISVLINLLFGTVQAETIPQVHHCESTQISTNKTLHSHEPLTGLPRWQTQKRTQAWRGGLRNWVSRQCLSNEVNVIDSNIPVTTGSSINVAPQNLAPKSKVQGRRTRRDDTRNEKPLLRLVLRMLT